jgi:hypothetical protein
MLTAITLLGCRPEYISAGEGTPAVYSGNLIAAAAAPDLVTITNLQPEEPAIAPEEIPTEPPQVSERLEQLIKLAESGVGDEVLLAFIQNSPEPFELGHDEIIFLTDIGFSDVVITALINHRSAAQAAVAQTAPPSEPVPSVMPAPEAGASYQAEPQVVYSSPPVVQYVTPAVQYSYFYSSLSPYGSWLDVPGYGWCWQPTVVHIQHGWRPYSDRGRWLYTTHGWYWNSDYSWGWAPFHYGRWFHHPGRGWCWKPGSTWGPAWVSWRYTDSYYGWAPLPPGAHYASGVGMTYYGARVGVSFSFGLRHDRWTFVPARRFYEPNVGRHRIHSADTLYRNSTVINNYIVGNNNTIVNEGIGRDRVSAATRTDIRRIAVREMPGSQRGVRPDQLHREGSDLVVYRPRTSHSLEGGRQDMASGEGQPQRAGRRHPGEQNSGVTPPSGDLRRPSQGVTPPGGATLVTRPRGPDRTEAPAAVGAPSEATRSRPIQPGSGDPARATRPSVVQAQPATPQTPRSAILSGAPVRTEPQGSWSALNPGARPAPAASPVQPQVSATAPQEKTASAIAPQVQQPQTFRVPTAPAASPQGQQSWANQTAPSSSPQTPQIAGQGQEPLRSRLLSPGANSIQAPAQSFRPPGAVPGASWGPPAQAVTPAAPQASPAVRTFRPETPSFTAPTAVPSSPAPRVQSVSPAPAVRPGYAPSPSFSMPAQRSYTAPQPSQPVMSQQAPRSAILAPSAAPAMRSAPQAVPAPSGAAGGRPGQGTPGPSWGGGPDRR